jgi:hypothetical protein
MPYHLIMVFHPRSEYNNIFVLYTKIRFLLPDLITDLRIPVFGKLSSLRKQFQAQTALTDICSRFAGYRYG